MLETRQSLKSKVSLAMSGEAEIFAVIRKDEDLLACLAIAKKHDLPIRILGEGTNTLLPAYTRAVVIHDCRAELSFKRIKNHVLVSAEAGYNWHALVLACLVEGAHGLENLALIPGSVGASPVQNIGAYGIEVGEFVDSISAVDIEASLAEQRLIRRDFAQQECEFSYRNSLFKKNPHRFLIERVVFKLSDQFAARITYPDLLQYLKDYEGNNSDTISAAKVVDAIIAIRSAKLPDYRQEPNAGSFFKNPCIPGRQAELLTSSYPNLPIFNAGEGFKKISAAWMLDHLGYRSKAINGFKFSSKHALVLTHPAPSLCVTPNHEHAKADGASSDETRLKALIEEVVQHVSTVFDVQLEVEPQWLN